MNPEPTQPVVCQHCGALLSGHLLRGLCTRCLARFSLVEEPEDGSRESEVRGQKSEDRSQRSDDGSQKPEDGNQESENGSQKSQDVNQESDAGGQDSQAPKSSDS